MSLGGRLFLLLLLVVAFAITMLTTNPRLSLDLLAGLIDATHAHVQTISSHELAEVQRDRSLRKPILVDVRTESEYAVSRIAGALHVPDADATDYRLADLPRNSDIVVYCAVGYRSAKVAARLQQQGFTRVRNLSGGIFGWANANHPVLDAARQRARVVHPFGPLWQRFLRPELRAP